jgi:uncharacterized phage protein gp47/JayE
MINTIQTGLQSIGKKITDFTSSSIIGNILAAIASVADELNTAISTARQQASLKTATGEDLDNKAADFGITRKQATYAKWTFVATKQTNATQQYTIPAGSLITTQPAPGQDPITFTVDTTTPFTIGVNQVNIPVTCQQAGSIGNITPGVQLLWGSAVPGIDGVQFVDASTGTKGIDTETDDQLRARALASFAGLSIGTASWYQSQALTVPGVASASVVNGYTSVNGVGVYITGPNNTLPTQSILAQVQSVLDNSRPQIDKPFALSPNPLTINVGISITLLSGYDPTAESNNVKTAISNYINGLGLGAQSTNGKIYPSQMITAALSQLGVADAGSVTLNGGTSPISVDLSQLPTAGTVTVTVITP